MFGEHRHVHLSTIPNAGSGDYLRASVKTVDRVHERNTQVTEVLSSFVTYAVAETTETAYATRHHSDRPAVVVGQRDRGHRRRLKNGV